MVPIQAAVGHTGFDQCNRCPRWRHDGSGKQFSWAAAPDLYVNERMAQTVVAG
jgi:hypothetical protein